MAKAVKRKLGGSVDGKPIKIVNTETGGSPEDLVHEAVVSQVDGTYDEIWLWGYNGHTSDVQVTIEFGGTEAPDQNISVTLAPQVGLVPIIPGLILQNAARVTAFASETNVLTLMGFINAITD